MLRIAGLIILLKVVVILAEYPYCFRFTWIGPYQSIDNIDKESCENRLQDSNNVPCRKPLVATDNNNIPDTSDLWREYRNQTDAIGCPMVPGETCVKYTYIYNKGDPYCFRFTWIGPYQSIDNIDKESCENRLQDSNNVPCRKPLVATDNNNIPDTSDLWREYRNQTDAIGCPMVPGETCVKYTYIYNKGVQNITYMCAKVNASTGCYHQKYNTGLEVEVCVCESEVGAIPCNASNRIDNKLSLLLIALITITIFNKLFKNS